MRAAQRVTLVAVVALVVVAIAAMVTGRKLFFQGPAGVKIQITEKAGDSKVHERTTTLSVKPSPVDDEQPGVMIIYPSVDVHGSTTDAGAP